MSGEGWIVLCIALLLGAIVPPLGVIVGIYWWCHYFDL